MVVNIPDIEDLIDALERASNAVLFDDRKLGMRLDWYCGLFADAADKRDGDLPSLITG